jgi:hypothetical protein
VRIVARTNLRRHPAQCAALSNLCAPTGDAPALDSTGADRCGDQLIRERTTTTLLRAGGVDCERLADLLAPVVHTGASAEPNVMDHRCVGPFVSPSAAAGVLLEEAALELVAALDDIAELDDGPDALLPLEQPRHRFLLC